MKTLLEYHEERIESEKLNLLKEIFPFVDDDIIVIGDGEQK